MIIECPFCESKVDGKSKGEHTYLDAAEEPFKVILLECPVCGSALLGSQEMFQVDFDKYDWSDTKRLWPQPEKLINWDLPDLVRTSLDEANKCYKAKAYSACAVMCGRILEGICKEFGIKNKLLGRGLKELLDKQIIDKKIYEWGQQLRKHRNIGAHASEQKISPEDAKDLVEFANAICEYVFVLTAKFEKFMNRQEKKNKLSGS